MSVGLVAVRSKTVELARFITKDLPPRGKLAEVVQQPDAGDFEQGSSQAFAFVGGLAELDKPFRVIKVNAPIPKCRFEVLVAYRPEGSARRRQFNIVEA